LGKPSVVPTPSTTNPAHPLTSCSSSSSGSSLRLSSIATFTSTSPEKIHTIFSGTIFLCAQTKKPQRRSCGPTGGSDVDALSLGAPEGSTSITLKGREIWAKQATFRLQLNSILTALFASFT
jgi:hypothetical protein